MDAHTDVPAEVEKVLAEARQMIELQTATHKAALEEAERNKRLRQRIYYNALKRALAGVAPAALLPYFDIGQPVDYGVDWMDARTVKLALPGGSPIYCNFERDSTNQGEWRLRQAWRDELENTPKINHYRWRVVTYQVSEDCKLDGLHEDRFVVHEADCTHSNDLMLAIGSAQLAEEERITLQAKADEMNANYREHRAEDMAAGRDWTAPAPPPPPSPASANLLNALEAWLQEREDYQADRYGEPEPRYD